MLQLKSKHFVRDEWVGTATFSPCGRYRYLLTRTWDKTKPICAFIGLNPSTADERQDDPTIRREIAFARDWGFGALVMLNAYAFRSTDPKALWTIDDPYGPDNLATISEWTRKADLVVAAWGANIRADQAWKLRLLFDVNRIKVHALRITKKGQPEHPLYLPKTLKPRLWEDGVLR
jgi:hypothetical protein